VQPDHGKGRTSSLTSLTLLTSLLSSTGDRTTVFPGLDAQLLGAHDLAVSSPDLPAERGRPVRYAP